MSCELSLRYSRNITSCGKTESICETKDAPMTTGTAAELVNPAGDRARLHSGVVAGALAASLLCLSPATTIIAPPRTAPRRHFFANAHPIPRLPQFAKMAKNPLTSSFAPFYPISQPKKSGKLVLECSNGSVTLHAPLRRGLKCHWLGAQSPLRAVTLHAPLRRGLKCKKSSLKLLRFLRYTPCPAEKGTETRCCQCREQDRSRRYTPCPAEKGTET